MVSRPNRAENNQSLWHIIIVMQADPYTTTPKLDCTAVRSNGECFAMAPVNPHHLDRNWNGCSREVQEDEIQRKKATVRIMIIVTQ
jgi:hypothetical protein